MPDGERQLPEQRARRGEVPVLAVKLVAHGTHDVLRVIPQQEGGIPIRREGGDPSVPD